MSSTAIDERTLCDVLEALQPVEFPALRDGFRRRRPEVSACRVRNVLVGMVNRGEVEFGCGPRGLSYRLAPIATRAPLQCAPDSIRHWPQRLLHTIRQAGRQVASGELVALYPECNAFHLMNLLSELSQRGALVRSGNRGGYRYSLGQTQPGREQASALPATNWAAAPAPEFGRPSLGVRCQSRIAA